MNFKSLTRRLATKLIIIAIHIVPGSGKNLAYAMVSEYCHINDAYDALKWAAGCVIACITLRVQSMVRGTLNVSRLVFTVEIVCCFMPLTLVWFDGVFGMSGVLTLNVPVIQEYFISNLTGTIVLIQMIMLAVAGVLGPVGMVLLLKYILQSARPAGKLLPGFLIAGPLCLGGVYLSGWIITSTELRLDHFAGLLIFTVLPAMVSAHLYYFYTPAPTDAPAIA